MLIYVIVKSEPMIGVFVSSFTIVFFTLLTVFAFSIPLIFEAICGALMRFLVYRPVG